MPKSSRVTLAVAAGLVVLGLVAYACVYGLQSEAIAEALAEQGVEVERDLETIISKVADEELAKPGADLGTFSRRLITVIEANPRILDLVVVDPRRRVVQAFSRTGMADKCVQHMPLDRPMEREHPAGVLAKTPVGCRSIPVDVAGARRATVLFHIQRDWTARGARAGRLVRRTALRLAPIFLGFYLLLGGLLVLATRAAARWRRRAEASTRMESFGAIASGINHEIKNPLNTIGLSLQFLARKHADKETSEVIASAERESRRIEKTLGEFVRLARVSHLRTRELDLGAWLRESFADFGPHLRIDGEVRVRADADLLEDAFRAILDLLSRQNAGGIIHLVLSEPRGEWRFAASCAAPELDAAALERLFDPYLSTRPRDVGRGLALARAVFQAHGGELRAVRKSGRLILRGCVPRHPPWKEDE